MQFLSDCHCLGLGAFLFHWLHRLDDISVGPLLLGYQDFLGETADGFICPLSCGGKRVRWLIKGVMSSDKRDGLNEQHS